MGLLKLDVPPTVTKIAWMPNPGPQTQFCRSSVFEVMYGGARGGGKTDAMLAEACRQAFPQFILPRVKKLDPGLSDREQWALAREAATQYRAIIFRRTFPELTDLIERAKVKVLQWYPGTKWQENKYRFVFPSGAILRFAYLKRKDDWRNYIGHEYQFLGYEELTNFEENAYIKVISSCRSSNPYLICQVRSTTNPGGPGHAWVRTRFVDVAPPNTTIRDDAGLTRKFIPAKVTDNPQLGRADPHYVARLRLLSERDQRAMIDGDWDAYEGMFFAFYRDRHVISWEQLSIETGLPKGRIPEHWPIFMSFDWGYGSPFSCGWWTVDGHGRVYRIREWYGVKRDSDGHPASDEGIRWSDPKIAREILRLEESWGIGGRVETRIADPSIFNPRRLSDSIKGPPISEEYANEGVYFVKADNDRVAGWGQLHTRLEMFPVDADHDSPAIFILDECRDWIRLVPSLPADDKNPNDLDTKSEDHNADETRYFLMSRPWAPSPVLDREAQLRGQQRRGRAGGYEVA